MFTKVLEKWPDEGKIGQDTLAESQRKWVNKLNWASKLKEGTSTTNLTLTELGEESRGEPQPPVPERGKDEGSTHLTPTDIGLARSFEINGSRTTKEE